MFLLYDCSPTAEPSSGEHDRKAEGPGARCPSPRTPPPNPEVIPVWHASCTPFSRIYRWGESIPFRKDTCMDRVNSANAAPAIDYLIIGGGLAGAMAAEAIREQAWAGAS